jgi:membrane-bound ClpP family serine protease
MAADVAAMAPGTSIGAAHPVTMESNGGENEDGTVMKEKLENFASSFIESIAAQPVALQLRYLQTMREISAEHSTIAFLPLPIDLLSIFAKKEGGSGK